MWEPDDRMKRREFMILLSGTASWPLAARAQPLPKLPTIGVLGPTTASVARPWTAALVQRLGELGWIEGRTLAIEYRWAEGRTERAAEIAAEFVRLKVDVMVTAGTANVIAAKQVTSVIPIVFASAGDPVGTGLVASLARPGGNVTGLSNQSTDLAAKRIELLREVVPGLRRLAIMTYGGPIAMLEAGEAHAAALTLGLEAVTLEIRQAEDITTAFEMLRGRAEALHLASGQLLNTNRLRINNLALAARLPTMHTFRALVESGGLMFYGPNFQHMSRRAADYVDKILRGTKPADIPVEQPTKFELVINLKTAKALGLEVPAQLLARADEVIE
jgi:putative tryptophan/tyrosine transport system substrate-binding protein